MKSCLDCNNVITIRAKRCRSCANKGKLNSSYKGLKYYCIDCGSHTKIERMICV